MRMRKVLLIAVFLLTGMMAEAETNIPASQARYIYNIIRYIKWPENSVGDKFIIAVYGNSPVYTELVNYTKTRKFGSKPFVVYRTNNIAELEGCHVVFVTDEKTDQLKDLKLRTGNTPTLVISEREGSIEMGANIELLFQNNALTFKINETATKEKQLVVSQELIKLSNRS